MRVVRLRRNFGKAAALTHGFAEARGELIVTMDGDRQDDPAEIPKLLAKLDEGYDLVSGWKQSRQDPVSKTLPSKLFNWTVRKSTGVSLHDFNCGLKAYRRRRDRARQGLRRAAPVHPGAGERPGLSRGRGQGRATGAARAGSSKYGWRRYARGYLDLLTVLFLGRYRQRPQHLFGGIGTFMVVVGVLIDLYLTIDKIFGHPIGQRPLLLLGTLLIIVGIQLLSLGLVGELITQARARDKRDDFEVDRVIDGAAARAVLDAVERPRRRPAFCRTSRPRVVEPAPPVAPPARRRDARRAARRRAPLTA